MKVGLYFGTFNPIHVGHLVIANYMVDYTDLDEVWLVVSPHNPLKQKSTLLADIHRLAIVQEAIENNDKLKASDIEFKLPKPSYTATTLAYLKDKHPTHQFSFIMGEDNLRTLHKWKNHEVLIANYQYLQKVASILAGNNLDITAYKLARKNVYVSSANLGSAFQRMLSEPKSKQKNSKELHKFVVLNHMLSSYTANLMTNLQQKRPSEVNESHIKLIKRSLFTLSEVIKVMKDVELEEIEVNLPEIKSIGKNSNESNLLSEQLELVNKLILDLQKLSQTLF